MIDKDVIKFKNKINIKMKNKIIRGIAGLMLAPIFFALYISDRATSSINPFITLKGLKEWINEPKEVIYSIFRTLVNSIIMFIIWLII